MTADCNRRSRRVQTAQRSPRYSANCVKQLGVQRTALLANLPLTPTCTFLASTRLAGKSTLLQILAGKRLTRSNAKVLGSEVFFKTPEGVTYLGASFRARATRGNVSSASSV